MVRSLWSAASGMLAQQTNVDTIANNLANVSTTGYKTQQNQFKSLLYQNLQTETTSANGETKPVGAQVGLGVRSAAITSIFTQGEFTASESDTDFAIAGEGFFAVRGDDGNTYYTRDGSFLWAVQSENSVILTNKDGLPVLSSEGSTITLDTATYSTSKVTFSKDGTVYYPDENGVAQSLNMTMGLYQFSNPSGLDKRGNNLYGVTAASGPVINEAESTTVEKSALYQNYLEASNVNVADEMVNLIVAQRAYELNSKAITATDQMMQQANQLRS